MESSEFCRIECDRQGSTKYEEMEKALRMAKIMGSFPIVYDILQLGATVEPDVNDRGFRRTPASFSDGSFAVSPELIPRLIKQLLKVWDHLSPQEIFQEFERIHPFADGNGRVGQILFNWRNGTLHDPEFAGEYVK